MIKLGCHVGNSGRDMLVGSVHEALQYHANCFMLYLGAPQNSFRKPKSEWNIEPYLRILNENHIAPTDVIVHAPYIVNLAQGDEEKRKFAVELISKEVKGTEAIHAKYIVVHPGAHVGQGIEVGIQRIAKSLQEILEQTKDTSVTICLETMAGKGTECCSKFEEIKQIMDLVQNERIKVCFDTCHTWDSGYQIVEKYDEVLKHFDDLIGLDKIKVIHLNDSKNECESHKDRHENIGFGKIGFDTLLRFAMDERFHFIPKILETPYLKKDKGSKESYPPYLEEIEMIQTQTFHKDWIENKLKNPM